MKQKEKSRPDVRDVVELRDDIVQQLGTGKAVLRLYLGRNVPEDNDGGHLGPDENGAHEQLKVSEPFVVTVTSVLRLVFPIVFHAEGVKTHFGSAASNSRMTKSALSGRWWLLQYA